MFSLSRRFLNAANSCNKVLNFTISLKPRFGFIQKPFFSFSLVKALSSLSSNDIYQRNLAEYEHALNQFKIEELNDLDTNQILQCIIIISQYNSLVDPLHRQFNSQINIGILALLQELQKKTKSLEDYFELIASNYFIVSHKLIRSDTGENWKNNSSQIDKLDINQVIRLIYLSKITDLVEEDLSNGPYPNLDLVFNIFTANASKYIDQLPILSQSLAAYLCVLLKLVIKHARNQMVPVQQDFERFVTLLIQKIIEDIHFYSPQKLFQIMDHVSFLSGNEFFQTVCNLFEKRLVDQDKHLSSLKVKQQNNQEAIQIENNSPLLPNQWLELVTDSYNEGRQNIELLEYVKQKLQQFDQKDLIKLNIAELPNIFFIFSKSGIFDSQLAEQYKKMLINRMPDLTPEQLAKVFFSYSYIRQMDDDIFENLIFYFESNPLDQNSLGILFFSLGVQPEKDEFSERMTEYLQEDKVVYILEAEDESCDPQFLLSFLYFAVNQNKLSNQIFQGYIFEKYKEKNLSQPLQTSQLLLNVLQILVTKPEYSKNELFSEFKNNLSQAYKLNKAEMSPDVVATIEGNLSKLEILSS